MAPWQVLHRDRASQAALGYYVHHGPRASVHYSTAAAAPHSSRSFCLSREKLTLQQLNRRLASYLQQVQYLEAANQRLEHQIQEELDTKCPTDLRELDRHLRTVSLLQDQISECLSAQAQVKLQLLGAELTVFDFSARCEKEREHRGRLEVELSDLRMLEEELKVHRLPELRSLLNDKTRQLKELQTQHQQDMQGLLAQVTEGIAVEMQRAKSSDLVQQLDDLRQTSVMLFDKSQTECWLSTHVHKHPQSALILKESVSVLSRLEVNSDLPEVVQAELVRLRRTAASLEEELTRLQTQNILLEDSALEQTESFSSQLVVLQERANSRCRDLDSVLQAAAQQAADHQALLDIKNKLETEIQDYRRLLDRLSQEGYQTDSFHNSENMRAEAPPERTRRESIHVAQVSQGLHKGAVIKASKMDTNPGTTGMTTLVPDTQSTRRAGIKTKPEPFTSKQTTKEAGSQNHQTGTHFQTEITQTIPNVETEIKQGPHFVTQTSTTDPVKQTAAELKKATMILAQMNHTEGCIQANKQGSAQVVSLKLESASETVGDRDEVALTPLESSGSHHHRPEGAQGEVSSEVALMDGKDVEHQVKKEDKDRREVESALLALRFNQNSESSDSSNKKTNKAKQDVDTGSTTATPSSGVPVSNNNLEGKTARSEILKTIELEMNAEKVVDGFEDANEVKVAPTESVSLAGSEALLSTTESKMSSSLTDSGVDLSSPDQSPRVMDVFLSPTKTFANMSPETCLSSIETEVLISMTDQVFYPVHMLEDNIKSSHLLLSPNDQEIYLCHNDSDKCLSPVETKGCLSPNGEEEDEEACLSLTEADSHVRPVEKYILSTKGEGQSLSLSREQALPIEGRNGVPISVKDEESLCFGSYEDKEGSGGSLTPPNINSRPTSPWSDLPLSSSLGSFKFRGPDKEEQLGFGGLHEKHVSDTGSPGDGCKDMSSIAGNRDVQSPGESPDSKDPKETAKMNTGVASNSGGMAASNSDVTSDLAASFSGTAANSSGTVCSNVGAAATAGEQGRFSRDSREWMVYGGSLGNTRMSVPSTGCEGNPSVATDPVTGRFGSTGSGGWMVYGGSLRHKSSVDAGSLPSEGNKGSQSVATDLVTNPSKKGRFSSRGGGEWMVYGGSLRRKSSVDKGDSLPSTGSEESLSVVAQLATSPPEKGRFGSRGSGEWRVYGGSTGCISSLAGSNSLPNAESEESPSVATQLATSPPAAQGGGRFGSGGSGEWRVYGGGTGRLSRVGSTDRVSANYDYVISPPSSYAGSGRRLSSAGSSGRLSSSSVVRRSSSVGSTGSGGRLISISGRVASTGSGEGKPVYSSAVGRRSSVGSAGRSGGGRTPSSQRAPSPGGRMRVGGSSGGWLSSSAAGENRISSTGSGSKSSSSSSNDRISSRAGSSGSGRTNSTGGRVISSSDRPIRSTGSGAGANTERISVCKMAALTISAAGRERSQERQRQAQRSQQQQQQQQAAATCPLVHHWLTTGVGVTSTDPDGLDDIMHL